MTQVISFQKQVPYLYLMRDVDARDARVRERYKHLACSKCEKIDEDKAIAEGISLRRKVPDAPVLSTNDGFTLMNKDGRAIFESIFGDAVSFQEVEDNDSLFLGSPAKIIRTRPDHRIYQVGEPTQDNEVFQPQLVGHSSHGGRCPICNRFYSVRVNPYLYQWQDDESLVGLRFEMGFNSSEAWVTTEEKAAELRAARIPSVRLLKPVKPLTNARKNKLIKRLMD